MYSLTPSAELAYPTQINSPSESFFAVVGHTKDLKNNSLCEEKKKKENNNNVHFHYTQSCDFMKEVNNTLVYSSQRKNRY